MLPEYTTASLKTLLKLVRTLYWDAAGLNPCISNMGEVTQKGPLCPESLSNQKKDARPSFGMTPTFQKKKKKIKIFFPRGVAAALLLV